DASGVRVARQELVRRGDKNRPALLKLVMDEEQSLLIRIAALSVVQSFWNDECKSVFLKLLRDTESDMRRLAVEALGRNGKVGDEEIHMALTQALADTD